MQTEFPCGVGIKYAKHEFNSKGEPNYLHDGKGYNTIDPAALIEMAANPQQVPKADAWWFIPVHGDDKNNRLSSYLEEFGYYTALPLDLDEGDISLEEIKEKLRKCLPGRCFLVYSTHSATADNKKWRVVFFNSHSIEGKLYSSITQAFYEFLYSHTGWELDRTSRRLAQISFLPNRGEYYEYHFETGHGMDYEFIHDRAMALATELHMKKQAVQEYIDGEQMAGSIKAFNNRFSIEQVLQWCGYNYSGGHWQSCYQEMSSPGNYSTDIMEGANGEDYWISLSHSDIAAQGLGKISSSGQSKSGDAYNLYRHHLCGNDETKANRCWIYGIDPRTYEEDYNTFLAVAWNNWQALRERELEETVERGKQAAALAENMEITYAPETEEEKIGAKYDYDIEWPRGLGGEIAKWIYETSNYPIKQFAIAGAAYILSIGSRSAHIRGSFLNQYMMLVAGTGRGKGSTKARIDALHSWIETKLPAHDKSETVYFAFEELASPQGLHQELTERPLVCGYREELGSDVLGWMKGLPGSNDAGKIDLTTRLWDRAQLGRKLGRRVYRDSKNSLEPVHEPCFNYFGDTQLSVHQTMLGEISLIDRGFLPRFSFVFYKGPKRMPRKVPDELLEKEPPFLDELCAFYKMCHHAANPPVEIQETEEAFNAWHEHESDITKTINAGSNTTEILNRESFVTLRLSSLFVFAAKPSSPTLTKEDYLYWKKFVQFGSYEQMRLLTRGEVGDGESLRVATAVKHSLKYFAMDKNKRHRQWGISLNLCELEGVVPESYFKKALKRAACFKGDNKGATTEMLIRRTVDEMVAQDYLEVIEDRGLFLNYKGKQRLFRPGVEMESLKVGGD